MSSDDAGAVLAAVLRPGDDAEPGLPARVAIIGWDSLIAAGDSARLGNVLAKRLGERGLVPPIPAMRLPDGRLTIPAVLSERLATHEAVRQRQRERLFELVAALNALGIEPLLLKGARSLWTGAPEWRSMRDLDLLVPRAEARRAQASAVAIGYAERDEAPAGHHHLPNLYRDDLPGWLEFHDLAGVPRVEALMRTGELGAAAERSVAQGATARLPPMSLHVLHGVLHHHIGHGGDKGAEISLKGLYEFAAETTALDATQRADMMARAARHPRLLAVLDLWVAAAAERFGMPVDAPLVLADDAVDWCARRLRAGDTDAATPGRRGEIAAALRPERLAQVTHPLLRHRAAADLATRWSFVQRPRLWR